jgi:hypothetical protein
MGASWAKEYWEVVTDYPVLYSPALAGSLFIVSLSFAASASIRFHLRQNNLGALGILAVE